MLAVWQAVRCLANATTPANRLVIAPARAGGTVLQHACPLLLRMGEALRGQVWEIADRL